MGKQCCSQCHELTDEFNLSSYEIYDETVLICDECVFYNGECYRNGEC
jgi:hypothetical protein